MPGQGLRPVRDGKPFYLCFFFSKDRDIKTRSYGPCAEGAAIGGPVDHKWLVRLEGKRR